jgi:hypothetical protein
MSDMKKFEASIKNLHPKLQEVLRNRLIQTEKPADSEAMLAYRGMLKGSK